MVLRVAIAAITAVSASNLHGLTPELQAKVASASALTCDNGLKTLPISSINDDYCDCVDGSDEPGTSACSHTGILFHCLNTGFFAFDIPTSRVNDGICDCCDGSDEYLNPSSCANTCSDLKAAHDAKLAEKHASEAAGRTARQLLVSAAKQTIEEQFRKRTDLEAEKRELEAIVQAAANTKAAEEEIEVHERRHASQRSRHDVARSLGLQDITIEQLSSVVIDLALKINSKDDVLSALRAAGVTSSRLEQLEAQYTIDEQDHRNELERINKVNEERRKLKENSGDEVTQGDLDPLPLPTAPTRPIHSLFESITKDEAAERPEAKAAREAHEEAQRKLTQCSTDLSNVQATLDKVYGADDVFLAVKDKCIEDKSGQYTYKMCFFGAAHQDSISLGQMQPLDASKHEVKFTGGAKCWNGPERSLTVSLECDENEVLYNIEEPATCVYTGKLKTPIACADLPSQAQTHDEL
ncbi:glucosidase [Thraustotheca clavata]|uniref:Glucosidase 2 subunit beta n=1 Tax=Thraustotheca clavata TaxID=74557 RepID=A0A1V9Y937_9STRA|nr:glucosidase [Thraustotheca clavata]